MILIGLDLVDLVRSDNEKKQEKTFSSLWISLFSLVLFFVLFCFAVGRGAARVLGFDWPTAATNHRDEPAAAANENK